MCQCWQRRGEWQTEQCVSCKRGKDASSWEKGKLFSFVRKVIWLNIFSYSVRFGTPTLIFGRAYASVILPNLITFQTEKFGSGLWSSPQIGSNGHPCQLLFCLTDQCPVLTRLWSLLLCIFIYICICIFILGVYKKSNMRSNGHPCQLLFCLTDEYWQGCDLYCFVFVFSFWGKKSEMKSNRFACQHLFYITAQNWKLWFVFIFILIFICFICTLCWGLSLGWGKIQCALCLPHYSSSIEKYVTFIDLYLYL